jgi:hypothetical protein
MSYKKFKKGMSDAGTEVKQGAKDAYEYTKKGTISAYHSAKRGTSKAYHSTKNTIGNAIRDDDAPPHYGAKPETKKRLMRVLALNFRGAAGINSSNIINSALKVPEVNPDLMPLSAWQELNLQAVVTELDCKNLVDGNNRQPSARLIRDSLENIKEYNWVMIVVPAFVDSKRSLKGTELVKKIILEKKLTLDDIKYCPFLPDNDEKAIARLSTLTLQEMDQMSEQEHKLLLKTTGMPHPGALHRAFVYIKMCKEGKVMKFEDYEKISTGAFEELGGLNNNIIQAVQELFPKESGLFFVRRAAPGLYTDGGYFLMDEYDNSYYEPTLRLSATPLTIDQQREASNFHYLKGFFWGYKMYQYHPSFKVLQLAALPRNSKQDPKLAKDMRKLTASFLAGEFSAGLY